MRVYFDTEFNPANGELLSLALVGDNDKEHPPLYLELPFNRAALTPFLVDQVEPRLAGGEFVHTRESARDAVVKWVGEATPAFIGWFCAWDMMHLQSLFGDFANWPKKWPAWAFDIHQALWELSAADVSTDRPNTHHALFDAIWTRSLFDQVAHGNVRQFDGSVARVQLARLPQ